MRIVYLESTSDDLVWLRRYYEQVFPAGLGKAQKQFHTTETLLSGNPYIGHRSYRKGVREFSIPNTPFSYIYRIKNNQIENLRIWDERQDQANNVFDV